MRQLVQFRIINMYVERYLTAHPEVRAELNAPPGAPARPAGRGGTSGRGGTGGTPPRSAGGGGESDRPTGAPTAEGIDQAVLDACKTAVEREVSTALERLRTTTKEFQWGEDNTRGTDGSGSEEDVGVTGYLNFRNIQSVCLSEPLSLSADARKALGNQSVPGDGTQVKIHRFHGGSVGGRASWSAWDNLAVSIEGGGAQESVAGGGAIKLILRTKWYWDRWGPNSETNMENTLTVKDDGTTEIDAAYEGTP